MQKLTGLERTLTALKLQEPDVVPHFEAATDQKVIDKILPGASEDDFIEFMDLDAAVVHYKYFTGYETVDEAKHIAREQWGSLVRFTSELLPHPVEPVLKSEKDLDTYMPPDPDEEWRYEQVERLVKRFKGQRAIIPCLPDVFNVVKDFLLGDVLYFTSMIRNPDLIERASEIVLNYQLKFIKNCVDVGADIMWVHGDWAATKYPMVSPKLTAKLIAPYLQKMVEYCHSLGVPCLKHTDGNVWPLVDILINAGIDALHPIDPMAGMDIGEAKAKFGNRVCLMGNVSCAYTLCDGTIDEVRQETKEVIRKAGKGGGFICTSSNGIHSGVNPDNYIAFVKAIREYGKYPLMLD